MGYYIKAVQDSYVNMEQYRSGHNGHDWKSCVPQKGTEGSNPSCSAITNPIRLDGVCFMYDVCRLLFGYFCGILLI